VQEAGTFQLWSDSPLKTFSIDATNISVSFLDPGLLFQKKKVSFMMNCSNFEMQVSFDQT
jgi:hypothetical protein